MTKKPLSAAILSILAHSAFAQTPAGPASRDLRNVTPGSERNIGVPIYNPVFDHAAPTNGVTDATTAIAASLSDCSTAGGGTVILPSRSYVVSSADLTVPTNCRLVLLGHAQPINGSKYNTTDPAILLSPGHTINVGQGASLDVAIFNPVVTALPTDTIQHSLAYRAAFSGTAITVTGASTHVENSFIIGYQYCYSLTSQERPVLQHVRGDCGYYINNVQDVGSLNDVHVHTYMPSGAVALASTNVSGAANSGGGVRLTVASTANFATGNTAYINSVGGFTGANGKWLVTVVDGTHLDLQSSASAPTTTGTWSSGSKAITVASTTSLWMGQTVSGTNIAGGSTIQYIDWQAKVIYLSAATTGSGSGTTLTFGNGAYTSGGAVVLSADTATNVPAFTFTNNDLLQTSQLFSYGYETVYFITGSGVGNTMYDASCDMEQLFDPASVCTIFDASTSNTTWVGGSINSSMTALYDTSLTHNVVSDLIINAQLDGSVPISVSGDRLVLANSQIQPGAGVTLSLGVGIAVSDGIGGLHLAGDRFDTAGILSSTSTGKSKVFMDFATSIQSPVIATPGVVSIGSTTPPLGTLQVVLPSSSGATTTWGTGTAVFGAAANGGGLGISYNQSTHTAILESVRPNTANDPLSIQPAGATSIGGSLALTGIASASGADILCYNPSGGPVTYATSVIGCVPSSLRFKNPLRPVDSQKALTGILSLTPGVYTYKSEMGLGDNEQAGAYAEQVCAIDEVLCHRDQDGKIDNYDKVGFMAFVASAVKQEHETSAAQIKELQAQIDELRYRRRR